MKKGFTLVELSIVLVIIGLLVGGILVGQSLISSATSQAQIRQIQQFDIAVSQFKSKFKFIPGDSPRFANDGDGSDPGNGVGDGNGLLQNRNSTQQFCHTALYIGECDEFWKQLGEMGIIKGKYTNDYSAGIVPDVGAPRGIYKHTTVLPYYWVTFSPNKNYFVLQGNKSTTVTPEATRGPALTAIEVMAMDAKMDDGLPDTGLVRAKTAFLNDILPATQCIVASAYDVTNPNQVCSPFFEMLAVAN